MLIRKMPGEIFPSIRIVSTLIGPVLYVGLGILLGLGGQYAVNVPAADWTEEASVEDTYLQEQEPDQWIDSIALQVYATKNAMDLLDFDYRRLSLPDDAVAVAGAVSIEDESGRLLLEKKIGEEGAVFDLPGYPEKVRIIWSARPEDSRSTASSCGTWYARKAGEKIGMDETVLLTALRP
jgi:hypothetical protein